MNAERRTKRSENPHEAAALYLAAAAARGGAAAVAVGDEEGFLVAGAGSDYDLEWLAAVGAAFVGRSDEHGPVESLGGGVHAAALDFGGGRTLYLSAIGASLPSREEASAALGRILAPAWA